MRGPLGRNANSSSPWCLDSRPYSRLIVEQTYLLGPKGVLGRRMSCVDSSICSRNRRLWNLCRWYMVDFKTGNNWTNRVSGGRLGLNSYSSSWTRNGNLVRQWSGQRILSVEVNTKSIHRSCQSKRKLVHLSRIFVSVNLY